MGRVQKVAHFLMVVGTCIMGGALLSLGTLSLVAPDVAGATFGIPGMDAAYVTALGCRDLALGATTLALFARRPTALRSFVPATVLVAVFDAAVTLHFGPALPADPLLGVPLAALPHVAGIFAIMALALIAWHDASLDRAANTKMD